MKTFDEVWAEKEREGYRYGDDALEQVRFGWELAQHARGEDAVELQLAELRSVLDSPQTEDFLAAVRNEAGHQVARWGTKHDSGKAPTDWFWLLGYLSGKALHAAILGDRAKALHHAISSAAVLMNWHRALSGAPTNMRPGIDPPEGVG